MQGLYDHKHGLSRLPMGRRFGQSGPPTRHTTVDLLHTNQIPLVELDRKHEENKRKAGTRSC